MNDLLNNKLFEEYPLIKFIVIFIILGIALVLLNILITFIVDRFSEKNKIKYSFIKSIIFALAFPIVGFWVWYTASGNPFNEYLLITKSKTIKGFIVKAEEFDDVIEKNDGRTSTLVHKYNYDYWFTLPEGKTISGSGTENGTLPEYLNDLENTPYRIDVEYLSDKPEINRVKGMPSGNNTVYQWIRY